MSHKSGDRLSGILYCAVLHCKPRAPPFQPQLSRTYAHSSNQPTSQPPPPGGPISRAKKILSAKRVVTISHAPDIMTPIALTQHIAKKSRLCHHAMPLNPRDQLHQTCVIIVVARGPKSAQERERERGRERERDRVPVSPQPTATKIARYQLASKSDGRRPREPFIARALCCVLREVVVKAKAPHSRIFFSRYLIPENSPTSNLAFGWKDGVGAWLVRQQCV